jgi:RsiW-degrading membrane proteinase PrsW (M82 family)
MRDKYEKEPLPLLLKGLFFGGLITIPVVYVEVWLTTKFIFEPAIYELAYKSYVVAGFTEEMFKFLALWLVFWNRSEFNEKFDGIVYAVFVSLGFAAVENLLYVTGSGIQVGLTRAFTAVPAHALFGVTMGYYLGLAKFYPAFRQAFLLRALFIPVILHGSYDFILLSEQHLLFLLFIPFLYYLWRSGMKKMQLMSEDSPFNPNLVFKPNEDGKEEDKNEF